MSKLRELIVLLLAREILPEQYRDHPLRGAWKATAMLTSSRTGC
jgi:mRNA-degrading endonuclease YafQ of YafQ-DinJ toxin-antitoxin module